MIYFLTWFTPIDQTVVLSLRLGPENLKSCSEKKISVICLYIVDQTRNLLTKQTNKKLVLSEYYGNENSFLLNHSFKFI